MIHLKYLATGLAIVGVPAIFFYVIFMTTYGGYIFVGILFLAMCYMFGRTALEGK